MSVNKVSQTDGSLAPIAGGTLYADEPIGTILPFGGSAIPNGFLLCNGAAVSRTTYAALFAVIGTSFGSGDGSTTFNIPDLRGEFLRGVGTNSHTGQGNGGTVGEHQDATEIAPSLSNSNIIDSYNIASGVGYSNSDVASKNVGLVSFTRITGTTNTGGVTSVAVARPTNTSVNYIIKATSLALPTDFADAVDEKITANMIDSVTDGSQKAVTSNAVYDALATANEIKTVNITKGSNVSTFTAYGRRFGKVVIIHFDAVKFSSISSTTKAFTGLPHATTLGYGWLLDYNTNNNVLLQLGNASTATNGGTITAFGGNTTSQYWGNITYITDA